MLKERNQLSKLKSSTVEQDFKDVHRIGSRKEGVTKLEEFMLQFVPILDQHKQDQKRIIESGVLRLESEVLSLMLEDHKVVQSIESIEIVEISGQAKKRLDQISEL